MRIETDPRSLGQEAAASTLQAQWHAEVDRREEEIKRLHQRGIKDMEQLRGELVHLEEAGPHPA